MRDPGRRVRSVWQALWRSKQLEAEMREEMRFHIEMEADRLAQAQGLDAEEARRQAYVRFGGVEKYKEEGRSARGLHWLDTVSLDARLGVRMLAKHRWLTLVGGVAMAVAIALGATAFEIVGALLRPALPFPEGERVVAIKYASSDAGGADRRVLHVFDDWRRQLTTIEKLTAYRTLQQNLVVSNAAPESVKVAEITASAFEVARTPPLAGRYLLPSDEESAAPVVVIGHKVWRARFAADPGVVGRTILIDGTPTTIVGIMPEGFGFPVDHQLWMPLRLRPSEYQPWRGPELHLFGRLAPGATVEQAEAELAGTGRRLADAHPERPERLEPVVLPFTREHLELTDPAIVWLLRAAQFLVGALSFVVAVNLAILLYARTITRLGEIAVRTALGASRGRILSQLFIEALALTLLGAAVGLVFASVALREIAALAVANGSVPFWIQYELTPSTVLYAVGLAVVAALIMGVLPGLKATGARLSPNLQELNGRTGARLGPAWTTLIVAQVAIAVALLPAALYITWHVIGIELTGPTVAVDQFVVANLMLSGEPGATGTNLAERQRAVMSRLREEPGVAAVTFSSAVPGFGGDRRIEIDTSAKPRDPGAVDVASFRIAADLLTVYGTRMLAGRQFDARDTSTSRAVIVNRTFAELLEQPNNALGVRFRDVAAAEAGRQSEWYEVVGVVDDFPGFPRMPGQGGEPTVYLPGSPGDLQLAVLSVRFNDTIPADVAERFRLSAAEVDPALQLRRIVPLSQFYHELRSLWRSVAWAVGIVTLSVLLLSAAGVQAMMSFTIAQRTREIGIRSALGAQPRRLLLGIFGRAMRQLGIGVLVGSLLSVAVCAAAGIAPGPATVLLLTVAAVMTIVVSLAALGPARRSLRVQTIEALRMEG